MAENQKEKFIGRITHYFDHLKVAVIALEGKLEIGDDIRIKGGKTTDFTQEVQSMESEHQRIEKAKKGDSIGLVVKEKVREGYKAYKVE